MKKLLIISISLVFIASVGCARQPTDKRTLSLMTSYFKKYAKQYPDSVIGQNPLENIKLLHIEEIHKGMVVANAILELSGGMGVQVRFTMERKPLGWRATAWENMGVGMRRTTEDAPAP